MQLFCPACQAAFPGVSRCPRCGGLLLMPHEVNPDAPRRSDSPPPPLQPTAAGRIVVGTVLALGLYLGVRKLVVGAVIAAVPDPAAWWLSFPALVAVSAAQAVAVVFGAVVAAAGRGGGSLLGLAVGAVCGGSFLGFELLAGAPSRDLVFYLQPPVLLLIGLVSGVVGSRVWGAAPVLDIPLPKPSKLSSLSLVPDRALPGRPTVLARVLVGAMMMTLGVAVADPARVFVQRHSGGILRVQNLGQGQFISWQLATLAVLLGGVTAGAGTGAGIRHGVLAGLIGATGVLAVCASQGGTTPPVEYWLSAVSLDGYPLNAPVVIVAVAGGVWVAAVIGGWLGGTLFLPLAPEYMRQRLRAGLD